MVNTHPDRPVVIVTGSSGRIGAAVVRRFAGDFRVIGFDRPGPPHPPEAAEAIDADLSNDSAVAEAFGRVREHFGRRIAAVIHLAAYYNFSGEPSEKYETVTVQGTRRLLEHLQHFECEQFVFSSTMLVHRPCRPGEKIDESWPLEGKWDYPASKIRTEQLMRLQRGPIPVVMLRIAGVYTDRCDSIPISHQIKRIYERQLQSHVFPGNASHGQSFVHLDDVVESIWLTVQRRRELPPELPLLIGEPETLSYSRLQHDLGQLLHGRPWRTYRIPKLVAKVGAWVQNILPMGQKAFIKPWMIELADDHYELDIASAEEQLGWVPRRSLAGALSRMIASLERDPAAWYRRHELGDPPRAREHRPERSPDSYREA